MEEQFERIIKVTPAYDKRSKGFGIGSCTMFMVLKGSAGAVILTVSTGWFLPCTTEWQEMWVEKAGISNWKAMGAGVSYCSPVKRYDWQEARENCDWLGCACYGETCYTCSDEPFDLLLNKGSDAVFDWLTDFYHTTFTITKNEANDEQNTNTTS